MNILSRFFIICLLLIGFSSLAQKKYISIRDGLYKDHAGNFYFKTIDKTDTAKNTDRYIHVVYSSAFGVGGLKPMKDVVHAKSFKTLGNCYYKDKNHVYYFFEMGDGGTMSVINEANTKNFKVFENSVFATDGKSIFSRGRKIDNAHVSSFEPIIIKNKCNWYAKDKNNYYCGYRIMTEEEIGELKEMIKTY